MEAITRTRAMLGVDVGKQSHWCCLVTADSEVALNDPVANREHDVDELLASLPGGTLVVVDQARDIGSLVLRRAEAAGLERAYLPGTAMHGVSRLFAGKLWAGGFLDMKQRSWQEGHMCAFEAFGGVPCMWVPDNAATATDRTVIRITLVNREYARFADHYGAALVPARVRKPRDKSVAESSVNLVEQGVIGSAGEMRFYTLEEFNNFCAEKVAWLNSRLFAVRDGSHESGFEGEERARIMLLLAERYEMCEWRSAKIAPGYHVTIDYVHCSMPFGLVGRQADVRLTSASFMVMHDGEIVAEHRRLYGRKGQYPTMAEHMSENHSPLESPWSPERFTSWARHIGPESEAAVRRVMESRPIVEQSFVACRNILGLSKTYAPALLERVCAKIRGIGASQLYGPEERDPGHQGCRSGSARDGTDRPCLQRFRFGGPREVDRKDPRRRCLRKGR